MEGVKGTSLILGLIDLKGVSGCGLIASCIDFIPD